LLIWLCVECTIYWLPKKNSIAGAKNKKNPLHFGFLFIPPVMAHCVMGVRYEKKKSLDIRTESEKLIFHNGIKMLFGWDLGRFQQKLQIIKINFYGKMGSLLGTYQKIKIHEDIAHHMKNYILTISYSMFMDVRMYMRYVEANNWFCKMVTDCGTPING
jgi:hypothetical protein